MTDVELTVTAPDHILAITYRGRTWNLLAYALDDFGAWKAIAHEQGTDGPTVEGDVTRDPWSALATLAEMIIRREGGQGHGQYRSIFPAKRTSDR